MAQNSKIEWCHHTVNLWWGCTKVHAGCDNCYAETLSRRWNNDVWGPDKNRKPIKKAFSDLDKFQKLAAAAGEVHRVFVGSMMDIFEKPMPLMGFNPVDYFFTETDGFRGMLFSYISAGNYPNLQFLFLTKRPSNINKYIPEDWKQNPPTNVMFGTSISDQKTADDLLPQLLKVNGKKFLSIEPLLGPIDLNKWLSPCSYYCAHKEDDYNEWLRVQEEKGVHPDLISSAASFFYHDYHKPDRSKIDWVIVGGESGHGARPMHPDWVRSLRDQCTAADVPFFFKQWGEWADDGGYLVKVGKKLAGRTLDGKIYNEFPL